MKAAIIKKEKRKMDSRMPKAIVVGVAVALLLGLFPLSALACNPVYAGDGGCAGFWFGIKADYKDTYKWKAELWQVGAPDTKVDSQSGSVVINQFSQLYKWIYVPTGADPNNGATWQKWNVTCDGQYYVKLHWERQGGSNVWNQTAAPFVCETPSAVTLASFSAAVSGSSITLSWETASELENLGFNLYRAESVGGTQTQLNASLIPAQAPGSAVGAAYQFVDANVSSGVTYYYWLEDLDVNNLSTVHGPVTAQLSPVRRLIPVRPRLGAGSMGLRTP
jgi:hypothetical protein